MNINEMIRAEDCEWAGFMLQYESMGGYERTLVDRMTNDLVAEWLVSEFEKMMKE